ncbi:hypothetical protein P7C70_g5735, partial [Phenoliferia sp. Uapishka_3]
MTSQPNLPYELVEYIIHLAVSDFSASARLAPTHDPHPLHYFLRSTSLVSSTFRSISQPLLLHNAFLTIKNMEGFITALGRAGTDARSVSSLSVGPENNGGAEWNEAAANEVAKLLGRLMESASELEEIEFLTVIPDWEGGWLDTPNKIKRLVFTHQRIQTTPSPAPPNLAPTSLTFHQPPERPENFPTSRHISVLAGAFPTVTKLSITTSDFFPLAVFLERLRNTPQPHLLSLHLEAHETSNRQGFITANSNSLSWDTLEVLEELETHSLFLPPPGSEITLPPTLKTVKVIRDPRKSAWKLDRAAVLGKVMEDVQGLNELRVVATEEDDTLDGVRKLCEGAGVKFVVCAEQ